MNTWVFVRMQVRISLGEKPSVQLLGLVWQIQVQFLKKLPNCFPKWLQHLTRLSVNSFFICNLTLKLKSFLVILNPALNKKNKLYVSSLYA